MEKEYAAQEALQPGGGVMASPVQGEQAPAPAPAAPEEGVMGGSEQATEEMMSKADQAYIGGLMKMLHSKETAPLVEEMLAAGPPDKSIPTIANQVNAQMEAAVGKKPSLETALMGGVYLVQDLAEIGTTAGYFEPLAEEQMKPILQQTMQIYIEAGLKDGSIDPVELQEKIEPLMDDDQRATGMQAAEMTGVSPKATEQTAMAAYGRQKERQGMMKNGGKA